MGEVKRLTAAEFGDLIGASYGDDAAEVLITVGRWLARGDGAAVYRNQDMGNRDLGQVTVASYGSPAAQLETAEPPATLPDIGGVIGWRYQLEATYSG